jgi:two-component system torCAD operon response regulator TorR
LNIHISDRAGDSAPGFRRDRPAIRVAMTFVGGDRALEGSLRRSLEERGAIVQDWAPRSDGRAAQAAPETDVLLINTPLLDARVSALIQRVAALPAPYLIVLSDSDDVIDRIVALELGADDYLTNDSDPREILARARSLVRRGAQRGDARAQEDAGADAGEWILNDVTRVLQSPAGATCALAKGDVDLISALTDDGMDICAAGSNTAHTANSLRVSISRLRRRFQKVSDEPLPIRNVWGLGYTFDAPLKRTSLRAGPGRAGPRGRDRSGRGR